MTAMAYRCAVVEHGGAQYFVRLPTEDPEEAKARIRKRGWTFLRWSRADEPKPNFINRLYPYYVSQ